MAEYGKKGVEAPKSSATKKVDEFIKANAQLGKKLSPEDARKLIRFNDIRNNIILALLGFFGLSLLVAPLIPKTPQVAREPSKEELEKKYTEHCRLTAQWHTAEQGSSMFTWAQGDRPDQAILHFKHPKSGRRWTTLYVCDFYKQIDGEWVETL